MVDYDASYDEYHGQLWLYGIYHGYIMIHSGNMMGHYGWLWFIQWICSNYDKLWVNTVINTMVDIHINYN